MQRPKITKEEIAALIKDSAIDEAVYVVAIRGYYKNSMGKPGVNDRGIYDDAIILVAPNVFLAFNGNTDPSKFKAGIATLIPGLHYYKKGKHGYSSGKPYSAFRPATPDECLPVNRDGQTGVKKGLTINLHRGGEVYTNSAGCQTIHPTQWKQFQTTVYDLMTKESQRVLPYLLINAA